MTFSLYPYANNLIILPMKLSFFDFETKYADFLHYYKEASKTVSKREGGGGGGFVHKTSIILQTIAKMTLL